MLSREESLWCGHFRGPSGARHNPHGARPFALPGARRHFGRDRTGALKHMRIDVALDFDAKSVSGTVTHTIESIGNGLREVALDAGGLTIDACTVDGTVAPFSYDDEKLRVMLPSPAAAGATIQLEVAYSATPTRGLFFIGPDAHRPDKWVHAWTQCQDEDARYWLPCPDYPDQKVTTELICDVPTGMFVLSNGTLAEQSEQGDRASFHWKQEQPHATYLLTLAAGPFESWAEEADGVPLTYYYEPGREAEAKRSMGKTPAMMELFNRTIGVRYAWPKYAQVVVSDFTMGGMENTSATTLTDLTLHDAAAAGDVSSDPLVAHELAHQWFGDLVTCRTWSHAWLNEGFATFLETIWLEHDLGADEAVYDRFRQGNDYFGEDAGYRRPIVARDYEAPQDIFDCHLYQKAGRVLNHLRALLGPDVFWLGVRTYLERHAHGMVETSDLRRALEDVSGRDLGQVFDQWIFHGGHPDLTLAYGYDAGSGEVELTLSQTQATDAVTPSFVLDVPVVVHTAAGERHYTIPLDGKARTVHLRVDGPPTMVRLDPGDTILKTKLKLPAGLLKRQLKEDPDPIGRIRAAQALAKPNKIGGIQAVADALREDAFWGVRAECAGALGKAGGPLALNALCDAAGTETNPKARRAIAAALGSFRDAQAADTCRKLIANDASYYVVRNAAQALGKIRPDGALEDLTSLLERESHNDAVRTGALRGMGSLRDPAAAGPLRDWTNPDRSELSRTAAVDGLGGLAAAAEKPLRDALIEDLTEFARDRSLRVRVTALRRLARLGGAAAMGALRAARDGDAEARVRRLAGEQLRGPGGSGRTLVRELSDTVEKLRAETRGLTARIATLESLLGKGDTPKSPQPNGDTA
jgi:aminopeptidase N